MRDWKRILICGHGVSGRAASKLARARGQEVMVTDDRADVLEQLDGVEVWRRVERDTEWPDGIDGVVVSPGVPNHAPVLEAARGRGIAVVAEVEFAYQWSDPATFVGITGSNGKSTTTALTGEILRLGRESVSVCGNFGLALSEAVAERHEIYVVELSSFQLENIVQFRPKVAAWINWAPDHLDRHGSAETYAAAKARLFENQRDTDIAVINGDDETVAAVETRAQTRTFSINSAVKNGCFLDGSEVMETVSGHLEPLFSRSDLSLPGGHNLENAMAAALIARSLGVSHEQVRSGLQSFRGLPHRLEFVAEKRGVRYFNDSKGTNPAATAGSLAAFDSRVHLIVGGRSKGTGARPIVDLTTGRVVRIYGIGEAGPELAPAFAEHVPFEVHERLDGAVSAAAQRAQSGDVVLLSPACASFDQYENFERRGEHFRALVEQLGVESDG